VDEGREVGFVGVNLNMPQVLLDDALLDARWRFLGGCVGPWLSDSGDGGDMLMALSL
jgi:hypothetical protein